MRERIFILAMISLGFFWLVLLTLFRQVFIPDSWYYLPDEWKNNTFFPNFYSLLIWLSIFFLFSFVRNKKQNPYFIASLFLMNLFSYKIVAFDPYDNGMFLLGFIILIYFKNNPFLLDHKYIAFAMVVFYQIFHISGLPQTEGFTDVRLAPILYLAYVPTIYLLLKRKDYKNLVLILILSTIFLTGKYVANALPFYIFSLYLDFATDEKLVFKEKDYKFLLLLLVMSLFAFVSMPLKMVLDNCYQPFCSLK